MTRLWLSSQPGLGVRVEAAGGGNFEGAQQVDWCGWHGLKNPNHPKVVPLEVGVQYCAD